jgi:hypothetical protein
MKKVKRTKTLPQSAKKVKTPQGFGRQQGRDALIKQQNQYFKDVKNNPGVVIGMKRTKKLTA